MGLFSVDGVTRVRSELYYVCGVKAEVENR
jgi:hypothetical protein